MFLLRVRIPQSESVSESEIHYIVESASFATCLFVIFLGTPRRPHELRRTISPPSPRHTSAAVSQSPAEPHRPTRGRAFFMTPLFILDIILP